MDLALNNLQESKMIIFWLAEQWKMYKKLKIPTQFLIVHFLKFHVSMLN